MTTKLNVETFITVLRKSGLVDRDRLEAILAEFAASGASAGDPAPLVERMIAAELLTPWQTDKLLQGKHRGYFLGKYKLLSLLGKGGMSSVYLAEHLLLRRRCALKVLPAKRVDDSSYLERFHREAQAVAALDHPNIVRAYDVDHQNDGDRQIHFLVMEHVDGQSLQEIVAEKGVLSFLDAAEYARQAAAGLSHAHSQGMIHRDIKPANLLVDQSGIVKVLDLGLARFFKVDEGNDALTIRHDEKVLGTADYLAPEQALDSHTVDVRADLYSLGCTLYFLVTGRPPFTEGTLAQRLMAHQVKTPPTVESLRSGTPPSLAAIIRTMMEKQPADRYASADETEKALYAWIDANADDEWRKSHSGDYGSRSSDSGNVLKAIPIAQPLVATPNFGADPDPTRMTVAKPAAPTTVQPRISLNTPGDQLATNTDLGQFLSTLGNAGPDASSRIAETTQGVDEPILEITVGQNIDASDSSPPAPVDVGTDSPFLLFEQPTAVPMPHSVAATVPISPVTSKPQITPKKGQHASRQAVLDRLRRISAPMWGGVAAMAALVVVAIYAISSFGDFGASRSGKKTPLSPFPREKLEVTVGGPKSEYATIGAALSAVRERYRPPIGGTQTFVIRISPGIYDERLKINGRGSRWPEGITLLGEGDVHLKASADGPAIRLANVSRFSIENLQVDANDSPLAIELADDLHESHLKKLVVRGFTDAGVLCKGAQGLSFGDNQLFIEQSTFETNSTQACAVRLDEGPDNDSNSILVRNCRFMGPMSAGVEIRGPSPYGIDVVESVFNRTTDGVRVAGQPMLKSIHVINNSFRQTRTAIRFAKLPNELSTDLAIRRNLFTETALAEAVVQSGYDEAKLRLMLTAKSPGIENNWSDRNKPASPIEGEIPFLFELGGRQGESGFALASTDPKSPKFLSPTETSPQRDVSKSQPADKQWVGAIGP